MMRLQRLLWFIFGLIFVVDLVLGYQSWQSIRSPQVIVEWSTASELNTVGFNLLRSQDPAGPFSQVNENLIPASEDPLAGGSYNFTDRDVVAGETYYYQLQEVEDSGGFQSFGPIQVKAQSSGWIELLLAFVLGAIALYGMIRLRPQKNAALPQRLET